MTVGNFAPLGVKGCQTRAGESGNWFGIAPNEAKALATALAINPPIGMNAPSPEPHSRAGVLPRASAVPRIGAPVSVIFRQARISTAASVPLDWPDDGRLPWLHQRPYPGAGLRRTR
jgi:hypothetical protein